MNGSYKRTYLLWCKEIPTSFMQVPQSNGPSLALIYVRCLTQFYYVSMIQLSYLICFTCKGVTLLENMSLLDYFILKITYVYFINLSISYYIYVFFCILSHSYFLIHYLYWCWQILPHYFCISSSGILYLKSLLGCLHRSYLVLS